MLHKTDHDQKIYKPKRLNKLQIATKIDLTNQPQQTLDRSATTETISNIFSLQPSASQFKQERGPRYDKNGELVKYSLVGKADWFLKQQGKKAYFDESTMNKGNRQTSMEERTVYRAGFDARSQKGKQNGSERKQLKMKEQIRTKNQLLDEIDSIRARIEINRIKDEHQMNDLPDFTKKNFLKQHALFERHQVNQESWENFIVKASAKLDRAPGYSQLIRSESYRGKLEAAQTFEVLKSDFERYGTRVWYMTLRKSDDVESQREYLKVRDTKILVENKQNVPLIINEDLPAAFRHSSLSGMKGTIEYIRKPYAMGLTTLNISQDSKSRFSTTNALQTQMPFNSFHSEKYLVDRMESYAKTLQQQNMIGFDRTQDLDHLYLVGRSQLEAECEQVLNDKRDGMGIYKKYVEKPAPGDQQQVPEEVIAMKYSTQNKLKLPPVAKPGRKLAKQMSIRSSMTHASGMNISHSEAE